jgi:hypothetical protein
MQNTVLLILTLVSDLALYEMFTYHAPNLIYLLRCLGRLYKEFPHVRSSRESTVTILLIKVRSY